MRVARLVAPLFALALALPAAAQQPERRPHPPAPGPRPANEIPLDQIKLPPGFAIELYAAGLDNARSMTLGDKGTLFVGTRVKGNVYAVVDRGGRREVKTIASGLHRPNGVAFKGGALYVAELSRVLRFDDIENRLDDPPQPAVVKADFPKEEPHGWKFIRFGPDGLLYVPVGAPCNSCERDRDRYAVITRMRPDGGGFEVFARGVRNTVGFDWHPQTGELWFTDNGRDLLGDDRPPDELNHAPRAGLDFGFPYCHGGELPDPEFGAKRPCSDFAPPALKLEPHIAALGMRFYAGAMFPPEYRHRIFIAQRGAWDRSTLHGFNVLAVTLEGTRAVKREVFAEGWLQGQKFWGRPVDVLVMPDGALLISDDYAGAIYRVTYRR
jgi:glucose/arabinose dehydrogenase